MCHTHGLKYVYGTEHQLRTVKYGSMVFDSSLIIISTNIRPDDMARASGEDNMDAMHHRFTDTCGAFNIDTKVAARKRLPVFLLRIIQENIRHYTGIEIDI